ncbi:MAG: DUF6445 family protein [Candidatus Poseidoniales archaeon]|nr:DUF6445 family protein [Candidatus Poseidoniales archaeon]
MQVTEDIKGRTAIIIDDFYKNPDEIRELATSSDYYTTENLIGGFPGMRCLVDTPEVEEKLYDVYFHLCDKYFGIPREDDFNKNWNITKFLVNGTNDTLLKKSPMGMIPHQDWWGDAPSEHPRLQFGSVIYLNSPEECAGGTNLYSYNGDISIPLDKKPGWLEGKEKIAIKGPLGVIMPEAQKFKYIKDKVNNQYNVEFEAKMKYNRMVLYQSDVLHSAEVELGMFKDYSRINQVFFM